MYRDDYFDEPRHTQYDRFIVVQLWGRRLDVYSLKDVDAYRRVGIDVEPLSDPMTMDEARALYKVMGNKRS